MAVENERLHDWTGIERTQSQRDVVDRNNESLSDFSVTESPSVGEINGVHADQKDHSSGLQELDESNVVAAGGRSSTNSQKLAERVAEPPPEPSGMRSPLSDAIDTVSADVINPEVSNVFLELGHMTPEPHLWDRNCASASNTPITKTASWDDADARRRRPNNLRELAETLSEPLGLALATVFYEIFERNGNPRGVACPVDELAQVLEEAFKESFLPVLGRERIVFVESFKNSFRSSYMTIRSVRRAYSKTEARLNPYARQSGRGSASKSWRASSSQSHRELARRNWDSYNMGTLKIRKVRERASNYESQSSFEDDILSFITTGNGQEDGESDGPCSSSGKSCLNESLKSCFFTDSNHEQDGQSDTAGSCCERSLSEPCGACSCNSSSNEQDGHGDMVGTSNMTSSNKGSGSPLSQTTSDATDTRSQRLATDYSQDVGLHSATNSSKSSEWLAVDSDEITVAAPGPEQIGPSVSFKLGPRKQIDNHPPTQLTTIEGSTAPTGGGGVSVLRTGSSGILDNPTQRPKVLQQEILPVIARNSSDGYSFDSSLGHPADRLLQAAGLARFMTLGGVNANREISSVTPKPCIESSCHLEGRPDLLGGTSVSEGGNGENTLIHRRPGQVITEFTEPPLEDTLLHGVLPTHTFEADTERHTLLQRYVEAQETKNYLKSLEVAYNRKRLSFKEDYLQLQSQANILMRESVDLSRSTAEFNEFKLEDRKLTAAHQELSQMCADELVAGLCVMLFALGFAAWKFSYTRLSRIVTACELPINEPHQTGWLGTNWVYTTVNAFTWQLRSLTCELTKAGRMMAGLILIAFVTTSLVRRSVTSSSRSMPATIIVVVLAGICGLAGKISVDSLGGDGFIWVVFWEILCFLHAFAASCTPWLYKYLHGPSSKFYGERPSLWLEVCSILIRFFFHTILVFFLPVMAGLLPFASPEEVFRAFWDFWEPENAILSM